ncbi:lecithin:cholesterol acyltransferase [Neolewinella xylanilytica]|uniref:Lecithin:cholesterol acyltransferase n=1 Tax=Neolewinella xylanilytica TaxID=1514080 RepID=A0A2S6I6W0_9BACT|nr:CHAT domain-containing protein [Neolewinella xylanilytica]PPK87252.1 lecithin:cholesterol acyltransferase [Neolewinella xylanilytica]
MPPAFTLHIHGTRAPTPTPLADRSNDLFEVRERFDLTRTRGVGTRHDRQLTDEIVGLITEDDLEWFGYADDLPEVFGQEVQLARSGQTGFVVPTTIESNRSGQRGLVDRIQAKAIEIITGKAAEEGAEVTARQLAQRIDERNTQKKGLWKVDPSGNLQRLPAGASFTRALIFIHGTASKFESGFSNIDADYWQRIHQHYDGQVYAFNHPTLIASPVRNALDLLAELPEGASFDLITHSRGGLVGDVLARCDSRLDEKGYSTSEIELVAKDYTEGETQTPIPDEMRELATVAKQKAVFIHRIVRVACPAQGTTLLADRLDHFLNALLTLIGKAGADRLGPFYALFKSFLLKVIEEREDPATFPGLYAMVPDLAFIKVNNNPERELKTELVSILGDSDTGGGVLQSLKVVLSNLYYWQENDFVVNTASMSEGIARRPSNRVCTIANAEVDHFSYFDNKVHMAIITAILTGELLPAGVALIPRDELPVAPPQGWSMIQLDELRPIEVSGKRPVVVLLPGIMGSNLYHQNERQWMDLRALHAGGFVKRLAKLTDEVEAQSLIRRSYGALVTDLNQRNYDVRVFPYDWRKSLTEAARAFAELMQALTEIDQPVRIVAHSMGGLVVRQWMIDYREEWVRFRKRPAARVLLLGTPWRGSHLITQVLTGHARTVRQLALLDFKHDRRELLTCLGQLPGIFELLPLDDARMIDPAAWETLRDARNARRMPAIGAEMLEAFQTYREGVERGIKKFTEKDMSVIYYVAGHHEETVDDYELRNSLFWKKDRLRYLTTAEGDGSVSWKRGIPTKVPATQVYYTRTQHGELANDASLFPGLVDLLEKGDTTATGFSQSAPVGGLRSAGSPTETVRRGRVTQITDQSPLDNLFGLEPAAPGTVKGPAPIRVEVFNGDLKWARHPVLIGHFAQDGIVSAERALDGYLDDILSERHMMGFYPEQIGEQDVIIDYTRYPSGAIIVGLGDKEALTGYNLTRTVEKGILKYAVFNRDNQTDQKATNNSHGISTLFIGSNYGQLPLRESIRSILLGVMQANSVIESFDKPGKRLRPIEFIEFVDYYEDRVYECYKTLLEIEEGDSSLPINLNRKIQQGLGRQKRFLREDSRSWWQTFTSVVKRDRLPGDETKEGREYLDFTTYNRGSSVSTDDVRSNLELARYLAEELSTESTWNANDAKVIFELLVPNRYKDFIRNHRNIAWRMDEKSAAFPWEMFHDPLYDDKPTFTKSGLVRQLFSASAAIRPALVRQPTAMVIANPAFTRTDLPDLPAAATEGKLVGKQLQEAGFTTTLSIGEEPVPITKALFGNPYKIIHIASHGEFEPDQDRIGISIGGGQLLTPGTLRQFSAIPELVFVNCCFVGQIDAGLEAYRQGRHKLAANIGTQLIQLGVKAVVVAGWAVDDAAAKTFAEVFYAQMLKGRYFGEAVTRARADCYARHREVNTWGAYQCYGDQFYRCVTDGAGTGNGGTFTLEQEIILEFDNLISRSESLEVNGSIQRHIDILNDTAHVCIDRARKLGLASCAFQRRQALFYAYMADYPRAITAYRQLFGAGTGEFFLQDVFAFGNIRAKQLVIDRQRGAVSPEEGSKAIAEILQAFTTPEIVHSGPELVATVGSTYKRAALLADKAEARKYLKEGATCYLQAARERGTSERGSIYFATRFLTLATFANFDLQSPRIDIREEFGRDPAAYISGWLEQLKSLPEDRNSVYSQLAEIQLRLCTLVTGSVTGSLSVDARKHETQRLTERYQKQISECINVRELHGEIEHLEFLLGMCKLFRIPEQELPVYLQRILPNLSGVFR